MIGDLKMIMEKKIRLDDFISEVQWIFFQSLKNKVDLSNVKVSSHKDLTRFLKKHTENISEMQMGDFYISDEKYFIIEHSTYIREFAKLLIMLNSLHSDSEKTDLVIERSVLDDLYDSLDHYDDTILLIVKEINLKEIESDGGGEGGSEYCYTIFSLGDKFFKYEYSYYSYAGYSVDPATHLTEVLPKIVQVTKYYES